MFLLTNNKPNYLHTPIFLLQYLNEPSKKKIRTKKSHLGNRRRKRKNSETRTPSKQWQSSKQFSHYNRFHVTTFRKINRPLLNSHLHVGTNEFTLYEWIDRQTDRQTCINSKFQIPNLKLMAKDKRWAYLVGDLPFLKLPFMDILFIFKLFLFFFKSRIYVIVVSVL